MASQQGHWITNRHLYENPNEYDDVINVNPNVVERIQSSSTTSQHKLNSKMDTWKFVSGLALLMSFISVGVACAALLVVTKSLEQPDFLRQSNKDKNWESMQKANNKSGCSRGFIFNNTCIFLPPLEVLANYSQAANVCALADAELVKITNEKMFEAVCDGILKMHLEKRNVSSGQNTEYWIGNTFDPVNNPGHLITVTEDWKISLSQWQPDFPLTGSIAKHDVNLAIDFSFGKNGRNGKLFNTVPDYYFEPVCQYLIWQ